MLLKRSAEEKNKNFFPVMLDIENRECLVVGAGKIALRKINKLLEYGAKVKVVAPEINEEILNLPELEIIRRNFENSDIEGAFLTVAATDNEELNLKIANLCMERNQLVNNITSKNSMNVSFVTILENGDFKIGISGKGDPKLALKIREKIKEIFRK